MTGKPERGGASKQARACAKRTGKPAQFRLKPACAAILLAFTVQSAQANPTGASVVSGQASFATSGNTLTVTNTPGAIINWQGFSIGANEITRFAQQSAASSVLNRVFSSNPSSILGTLQSNGRVFLINPNGIMFGAGSVVDVAGMVASTLKLSDADFLAGRHRYTPLPPGEGQGVGVSNAGKITAQSGGQIYLIAPDVKNTGVITAPNGEILLAAGHNVELVDTANPNLRVNITAPAGDATNVGKLVAEAGSLGLFGTAVRNSGTASADSAVMQGGKIVFKASQRVEAGGTISAQGVGGGEIVVLADMHSGTVNVTGTLDASALPLIPSPLSLPASNGGFIETSAAHVNIADTARITTAAPNGKAGIWLIDPQDFTIAATGGDIAGALLSTALNTTNVLIQSVLGTAVGNGDIFVNDSITKTAAAAGTTTLTLQAENDIVVAPSVAISSTGSALNVIFNSDSDASGSGAIVMNTGSSIASNGGNILFGGGNVLDGFGAPTGNAVGNATRIDGIYLTGATLDAGGGNISLNGTGLAGTSLANGIYVTDASVIQTSGGGNITLNGTGGAGTNYSDGVRIGTFASISSQHGAITLTGQGGASTGTQNHGVHVHNSAGITTTGSGSITLNGTGGSVGAAGGSNRGVRIASGAVITTNSGNIGITGAGAYDGDGAQVTGASTVQSATGDITITGTSGAAGLGSDYGVYISASDVGTGNTLITTGGNIAVSGTSLVAAGSFNRGIRMGTRSQVIATGAGNIGMTGVGGYDGDGISMGSSTLIQANTGTISLTGTSGDGPIAERGIHIGNGTTAGATIQGAGDIILTGTSTATTDNDNHGIYLDWGSINSTGGNLTLTGTSLPGTLNSGINIWDTINSAGTTTLNSSRDIWMQTSQTPTGNMALRADMNGAGAGNVVFEPGITITTPAGKRTDLYYNPVSYTDAATKSDNLSNPYSANLLGAGTNTAWMLVNTLANLQGINANSAGNYALGKDIVANAAGTGVSFSGQFNGQNHTITGLTSSLFGGITASGIVSNVGLVNPGVTGSSSVGALAGWNAGTISNSYVSGGSVTGSANVGGLVGYNSGTITNSHVIGATVSSTSSSSGNAGGLAGFNSGSISNSYVSGGSVTGVMNVGGLVGNNAIATTLLGVCISGGCISNSYVSGGTIGAAIPNSNATNIGGLVGTNNGNISNSYVSGSTVGAGSTSSYFASNVGGLVGGNSGTVSNTYVTGGTVSGYTRVAGLVALNAATGSISSSYSSSGSVADCCGPAYGLVARNEGALQNSVWDTGTTGTLSGWYNWPLSGGTATNVVGLATADFMTQANFNSATLANVGVNPGFDFTNTWWMSDGNTRPFLRSEYSTTITNAHQLQLMAMVSAANYTLGASVDASETAVAGGMWANGFVTLSFSGQFDGLNHTITGLSKSLFSNIATGSTVSNVGLVNSAIDASVSYEVGALAKINNGTISNSYALNPTVSGATYTAGGLAGSNYGTISNSYVSGGSISAGAKVGGLVGVNRSTGNITGSHVFATTVSAIGGTNTDAGGLAGANLGTISNSYRTGGTVSGTANVGGLAGYNSSTGTVSNSYVTGGTVVSGNNSVGGLVGQNNIGTIANSYVSGGTVGTVSGNARIGGLVGYNNGSTSIDGFVTNGTISNSYVSGGTVIGSGTVGGLVGHNSVSGSISNSYVSGGSVSGSSSTIGGLVGSNSGTITNSYVTGGSVTGTNSVGGLAGTNYGSISNSYVTNGVIVSGNTSVGGLVGWNASSGTISNSYVSGGIVSATSSRVGGLVGSNSGSIGNSYVSGGSVTGTSYVGGLAGDHSGSTVTNSHYSIDGTLINGGNLVTLGGLYDAQYQDWLTHSLTLDIANYASLAPAGANSYTIATVQGMKDLLGFAGNAAYTFSLGSNVTLTSGLYIPYLAADFDGAGYTLSNLAIAQPNGVLGMFGVVAASGTVSNLGLINSSVLGGESDVGGLAGSNFGAISNSYVSGGMVSGPSRNVGGLVGGNSGSISGSHVSGVNVVSTVPWWGGGTLVQVGGLAGNNNGSISSSYVSGGTVSGVNVVGAGGLVGYNNGTISNSYVSGVAVSGRIDVGGLVGYNNDAISNTYASGGTVSGFNTVGGLVGNNAWASISLGVCISGACISNSYVSGGTVTSTAASGTVAGGLVGYNIGSISNTYTSSGSVLSSNGNTGGVVGNNAGSITNSFWDKQTTGQTFAYWTNSGTLTNVIGMNTADFFVNANFTSATLANGNVNPAWDFANTWWMSDTNTRPFLRMEHGTTITNAHQLQLMGMNLTANYTLANNLDLAPALAAGGMWSSKGFVPVGSGSAAPFTGTFDGQNFVINNLNINNFPATANVGLFGWMGTGSSVSNIGLAGGSVTGWGWTGALAGYSNGSINNVYVSGSAVSGGWSIGGLVGWNDGTIGNSYASGGTVSGNWAIGGLVGGNSATATITDSYVTGSSVSNNASNGATGGLTGYNNGTISNSHFNIDTVTVNGVNQVTPGGLYAVQYADWYDGGLLTPLDIANYASTLAPAIAASSYTIGSVQGMKDLLGFADNPAYTFSLAADITIPSGLYVPYLAADFDGAGFTVSGLSIAQPWASNLGLFGHVATGSTVSNLGLLNVSINGYSNVGGLAGNNSGTISNSYVNGGTVTGDGGEIGGLAGYNNGTIISSHVNLGTVIATAGDSTVNAGGLAGYNSGTISNSYVSNGSVVNASASSQWNLGGLVGYNNSSGTISNSYVTSGTIVGDGIGGSGTGHRVGGLVGYNYGTIGNSYVSGGSVSGSSDIGGLVGQNYNGTISNAYSTGAVSGTSNVGGLIGLNWGTPAITSSFWDTQTSGQADFFDGRGTGLTTAQMMSMASFTGWNIANTGGSGATWRIYEGNTAPLLTSFLMPLTITADPVSATYTGVAYAGGLVNPVYSPPGPNLALVLGSAYGNAVNAGTYLPALYSTQQGYDISYVNGTLTINPMAVALAIALAGNKVYDGTPTFSTAQLGISNIVGGDVVSLSAGTADTADRNVGINKPFVSFAGLALTGASAGNYTVTGVSGTGTITQLPSVAYTGGQSGNWSDAANWGGALPDGSNVAAVTIPSGVTVTYDSGVSGTTILNTLASSGSLAMAAGALTLNAASSMSALSMAGGTLTSPAGLTVNDYTQTAGTLNIGGTTLLKSAGSMTVNGAIAGNVGGTLTLQAANNILLGTGGSITGTVSPLNVILNSGSTGAGGGIYLDTGSSLASNGGNIVLGGGATGNGNAIGTASNPVGVLLDGATINSGAGNITILGQGLGDGGSFQYGVSLINGSNVQAAGGTITITGTGGNNAFGDRNYGVHLDGAGTLVSSTAGTITVTGTGGSGVSQTNSYGVSVGFSVGGAVIQGVGDAVINVTGTGGTIGGDNSRGVIVQQSGSKITAQNGAINIIGTGPSATFGSVGVQLWGDGNIESTGSGAINITGTAQNNNSLGGGAPATNFIGGPTATGNIFITGNQSISFGSGVSNPFNIQTSGNVTINANNANGVFQYGAGSIQSAGLRLIGTGAFTLDSVSNNVGTLAANVTGNLTYNDTNGFAIGSVTGFDGESVSTTTGVTATGSATFNAGGAITTSGGVVTANSLGATAIGGIALATQVANLTASNTGAGNMAFTNTGALNILGITQGSAGSLTIANSGALSVTGAIGAGNGTVALSASGALSDISVTGSGGVNTSDGSISLNAGQDIIHTGGAQQINTYGGAITLTAGRDIAHTDADQINSFSGALLLNAGRDILHTGSTTGQINTYSGAITLLAGRDIVHTDASQINSSSGAMLLNAGRDIVHSGSASQINNNSGSLTIIAGQDFTHSASGQINTNSGALHITAGDDFLHSASSQINTSSGVMTLGVGGDLIHTGSGQISTSSSAQTITVAGDFTVSGAYSGVSSGGGQTITVGNNLTISNATDIYNSSTGVATTLQVGNDLDLSGGGRIWSNAPLYGSVGGNVTITGGISGNTGLFGSPDIGSAASPFRVGGTIHLDDGAGAPYYGAQIRSGAIDSIWIHFPNLTSGGYFVNDVPEVWNGTSGFFANSFPAILDGPYANLHITYGPPFTNLGFMDNMVNTMLITNNGATGAPQSTISFGAKKKEPPPPVVAAGGKAQLAGDTAPPPLPVCPGGG